MSFYKGLAYLVYLESLSRVMHSIDSGSEKRSSDIVDLVHVLIFLMSKKERSVSAPLIDKVHATRRRQWMFGKASTSHTPSASRRLLASSFSADCHIVCHLCNSFPRDLGTQGIWEMEGHSSPKTTCLLLLQIVPGC